MLTRHTAFSIAALIVLALVSYMLWRIEFQYRYGVHFMLSFPAGVILWIAWANTQFTLPREKRIYLHLAAVPVAVLVVLMLMWFAPYTFSRREYVFASIPAGIALLLLLFGLRVRWYMLLLSMLAMVLSFHLAYALLPYRPPRGMATGYNMVKSALIIPLWFCSLGIIMFGIRQGRRR